jgi:radical SAM protein with 4Fe4S-binding SPASM domain
MQIITDLSKRYPGRIDAQAGPLALAREIGMIEQARSSGVTALSGRGSLSGCGGVFNNIAILHDGSIVPCHILSTLILGNITKDDLGQIWLSHSLMNAIRQRREISLQSLDTCCDCSFQGFCTGGCPGGALYINGEMNTCNPIDCYRVLLGKADPGEDKTGDILVPSQASLTKEL